MSDKKKNYYEILGVSENSTEDEIKKAYRKLVLKWHPDKNLNNREEAEEKMKSINQAYSVLGNPQKKKEYDYFKQTGFEDGFNPNSSSNFNDFGGNSTSFDFEDIISSFFGGGKKSNSSSFSKEKKIDGEDIELEINLTFKESIFGTKKNFNINLKKACKFCKQTGAKSASDVVICSTCQGKGFVNVVQRTIFSGAIRTQVVCNSCSGKGKVIKNRCPECLGKKLINKIEEVSFVVPKGINPDTEYKYPNLGNDGLIGGKKGDIFVKFNVNKDSYFIRKGNDYYICYIDKEFRC